MQIVFSERARKDWKRLDQTTRELLRKRLATYVESGQPLRFAEKLKDFAWGEYRFRIGDYRIVFDVHGDTIGDTIFVLRVGNRKDIYK